MSFARFILTALVSAGAVAGVLSGVVHFIVRRTSRAQSPAATIRMIG